MYSKNQIWSTVFDREFVKHYRNEYNARIFNEANNLVQHETTDNEAIKAAHDKVHEIAVILAGCKATDEAQAAVEAMFIAKSGTALVPYSDGEVEICKYVVNN